VTLQTKSAALGPGTGRAARGQTQRAFLPDPEYTPGRAKAQTTPPTHLTHEQAELWSAAEAIKGTNPVGYRELRRALLLNQAARYRPAR